MIFREGLGLKISYREKIVIRPEGFSITPISGTVHI